MTYSTKSKFWFTSSYIFATIGLIFYLIYAISVAFILSNTDLNTVAFILSNTDLIMNVIFFVLFIGSMGYFITGLVRKNHFQVYRSSSYIILVLALNSILDLAFSVVSNGFFFDIFLVIPILGGLLAYFGLRKSLEKLYSIPWMFYIGIGIMILDYLVYGFFMINNAIIYSYTISFELLPILDLFSIFAEPIGLLFFSLGILSAFIYFRKYK